MKDMPSNTPPGYREEDKPTGPDFYRPVTVTGEKQRLDVKAAIAKMQSAINKQQTKQQP